MLPENTFGNSSCLPSDSKLDQMILAAQKHFPVKGERGKYDEILDYIAGHPDVILNSAHIAFLIRSVSPALGQYREDYFTIFDKVAEAAKQTGNLDLVKEVYAKGIHFFELHKDNARKTMLLEQGIQYLLSKHSYHNAGELWLKRIGADTDWEERICHCTKALKYLDKSSEQYALAIATEGLLSHLRGSVSQKELHYCVYGQRVILKGHSVMLSPITAFAWNHPKTAAPKCLNLPVLKGYQQAFDPYGYWDKNKVIIAEELPVGYEQENEGGKLCLRSKEAVHFTQEGQSYQCHVFVCKQKEKIVENYFAENIGLVRTVYYDGEAQYEFELCEYSLKGGSGLLPLCVGNKWRYKQIGGAEIERQHITREIIHQNGEEYILSGIDCLYL